MEQNRSVSIPNRPSVCDPFFFSTHIYMARRPWKTQREAERLWFRPPLDLRGQCPGLLETTSNIPHNEIVYTDWKWLSGISGKRLSQAYLAMLGIVPGTTCKQGRCSTAVSSWLCFLSSIPKIGPWHIPPKSMDTKWGLMAADCTDQPQPQPQSFSSHFPDSCNGEISWKVNLRGLQQQEGHGW